MFFFFLKLKWKESQDKMSDLKFLNVMKKMVWCQKHNLI